MSSGIDKKLILNYYRNMNNEQLITVLKNDSKGLTSDAIEIIKEELSKRNISTEILKEVESPQKKHIHVPREYNPDGPPIEDDNRLWIEKSFQFLLNTFGVEETKKRKVLIPHYSNFPIRYDGSENSASETLKIISNQMEVPFENISLDFYDDTIQKITEGSPGGLYWGKGENEKYEIWVVSSLLNEPENMVATLSHEIAHIKLLGENRLEQNDEPITDLATIFFGLGIFGANSAFQSSRDSQYYRWSTSGYLTQMEWGYALALFAYLRNELNPNWSSHLCANVKADFFQALNFITNNENLITIDL